MAFGITPEGFNLKRLADIRESLRTRLAGVTDPVSGESLNIDFDSDDPLTQTLDAVAEELADAWAVMGGVITQFDPSSNTGVFQSAGVQMNGIQRRGGTPTTIPIRFTGSVGLQIEAGQRISDQQQNVVYITRNAVTIPAGGTFDDFADSENNGAFTSLANTVTTILTPVPGWSAVTNIADSTPGSLQESNVALRLRRDRSTEAPSQGPVDAIRGNLLNLTGVQFASVVMNNTLATDSRGLPAKTVSPVIVGGTDSEIAEALFIRTAGGVLYEGNTTIVLTDNQGEPYPISWYRPTDRNIFIRIETFVFNTDIFGDDGPDNIRNAIINYINLGASGVGVTTGFDQTGYVPGENVEPGRLYTPVNSIAGHSVRSLQVGFDANITGTTPLEIAFNEIASFDLNRIEIIQVT